MRGSLKWACGLLAVLIVGGLSYGCAPFVDRSAAASRPVPMPVGAMANPQPLASFIEKDARCIDAFIIHKNAAVAFSQGAVGEPMNMASARKSVLSLLYGIAWDRGLIRLDKTLGELGIDERATPLTDAEKRATIEHLLQARSGVYLPSSAETAEMKDARPQRGQYAPGEHHYYNNWDFNVLGHVFEAETGMRMGDALDLWLAQPLGMEDFNPSHVYFDDQGGDSDYPAYRMHMSARDLARLGTLVLQDGKWQGQRIVSKAWITRSLTPYSELTPNKWGFPTNGYGYSWWLDTVNDVAIADGWAGQYLYIDRKSGTVFVARCDTGNSRLAFVRFHLRKKDGDPKDLLKLRGIALAH
jgi:CubicO group peptidase (beta-lactamase class C family)